ncbi:MAG TPA: TetR/AcrR family transcriptional regulator [bacterium]|nr:TetR/AcrR family transcriptional regulator [bacterium]
MGIHSRSSKVRKKRKYVLKRRAEGQQETSRRIVEATVALHESLGPLAASISAIARRAGVERLTVRAHFPDQHALFEACTALFFTHNPAPDPRRWSGIADPRARLREALTDLYAFYGRTERMLENVTRDARLAPGLVGVGYGKMLSRVRSALTGGWTIDHECEPVFQAALGHALHFTTWRSLVRDHGLSDDQAVELMVRLVTDAGAAGARRD